MNLIMTHEESTPGPTEKRFSVSCSNFRKSDSKLDTVDMALTGKRRSGKRSVSTAFYTINSVYQIIDPSDDSDCHCHVAIRIALPRAIT